MKRTQIPQRLFLLLVTERPEMSEPLAIRAWRSHFPAMEAPISEALEDRLHDGVWEGRDFALSGTLALAGVGWSGPSTFEQEMGVEEGSVCLMAFCGIHEDAEQTEWASLSPKQARAIARALNKAAKLAAGARITPSKGEPS